ncbi:RNA polymerase sigma factor [Chryseobacterium lathyri]|uniref:RNA polymerase sigma-70 factor (ECF subfamily) n=1 Tax=Chryseobacterium lathyri TaxID=395933 RepID=A0ABT9SJD9_9FLAO|nr:sigma-70 family RNA polymerase sigma factor [Chryseobacterium lathyri]MDP9959549.1 RNA polymerase sigma-70 factor (ECF subfamily) [Chryseobacterium lathyri]
MNRDFDESIHTLTDHLFRENYGKMVSYLSQKYGYKEIENIVDAVQESFETALNTWKFSGIPDNHFAWLYRVAVNKLLNKIKYSGIRKSNVDHLDIAEEIIHEYNEKELEDSLLKLLIFFSKIDFSERNKLIISLYFLCGFGYEEIANALILKNETVKKVILRSKENIKQFAEKYDDFQIGSFDDCRKHLLKIMYLIFNEGYKTSQKKGSINYDLCYEAIRLAKLVQSYDVRNSEINSLLALMFFNSARFPARIEKGTWVSLEDQDRDLWDKNLIYEGFYYLELAKYNQANLSKYYIEALIGSVHCTSESYGNTNWQTISFLYKQIEKIEPDSISVKLNRIISESNFKNINTLLLEVNILEGLITKESAFTFFSSKAHLYFKLREWNTAIEYYELSLNYTKNKTDIYYIDGKIALIRKGLYPI